ncbi:hypothetical protein HOY80DRAFT_1115380, partial [Tuber brumale]
QFPPLPVPSLTPLVLSAPPPPYPSASRALLLLLLTVPSASTNPQAIISISALILWSPVSGVSGSARAIVHSLSNSRKISGFPVITPRNVGLIPEGGWGEVVVWCGILLGCFNGW